MMELNMPLGSVTIKYSLGFTYLGMLMLVAISGVAMAGVGIIWHHDAQREREIELIFVGNQFQSAIISYYEKTPSGIKQFPAKLEDLVIDTRYPSVKRHLRKIYLDPMTQSQNWGLVLRQGRITAIYSLSEATPIKKNGFPNIFDRFSEARTYQDWKFGYAP
jgi:type II secretory pathway pseudopilin PulG